uniref:DNA-directed RNA polymerase subunit beta'' n=1 Tax=Caloglossa monosticha TaxID=76906 RepID=A0A1Z1M5C6_9FLOR|nr:RNA polymerase b''''-subunit [Caloglossa monosticha]ARW61041.1 RNA polymerase b''''-subunit [Caloglossa monosticha]
MDFSFNNDKMYFFNKVIDKSELKKLITWAFRKYGLARASNMADTLKDLGFYYATKAGISLSLEDLRIPPTKNSLIHTTINLIKNVDIRYKKGEITAVEKFQKIIDTWHEASDSLKTEVIKYFKNTDPLNPIYMMAFSGARANVSQVRQLVGMRGLMSDPQGQIIDLPIYSNFREGLTVTDYFISSYGARKGLVDTALRTADSGYLTRRLVDVAQDIIIRENDCKTSRGILLEDMVDNQKVLINLQQALLGRTLAEDVIDLASNTIIAKANQSIDPQLSQKLLNLDINNVLVRSPLTCSSLRSICQMCYGWNLAHGKIVDLGEAVGIIAAQSIGEPGTQLTMRTFHTGGVFTGQLSRNILSPDKGILKYPSNLSITKTRTKHGNYATLINHDCQILVTSLNEKESNINLLKGSLLLVDDNSTVEKNQVIAEFPLLDRFRTEKAQKIIVADFSGSIHFSDLSNYNKNTNNSVNHIKQNIVVWILGGKVYNIPREIKLLIKNNQNILKNSLLACHQLLSKYDGYAYLIKKSNVSIISKLLLVTSSTLYTNIKIFIDVFENYKNYILELENKEKFILRCKPNNRLVNQQIVADMISDAYKTKTGGIIKYLDVSIAKSFNKEIYKDTYDIIGSGYILWISEETHLVNKDLSLLFVSHGQFVEVGTEIMQNIFACNSGIVEVLEKDGIVREIIIKPGILYPVFKSDYFEKIGKYRGFLRPQEFILNITTDKLVYWEYMLIANNHFILLRPVIIYAVPNKNYIFKCSNNSFKTSWLNLKLIRRTYFKDGERVKSISGLDLITTHLIFDLKNKDNNIKSYIQLEKDVNYDYFFLKFITADFISIRDSYFSNNKDIYTKTNILVQDSSYVQANSVVAQTNVFSNIEGQISHVQNNEMSNKRFLIIDKANICIFHIKDSSDIKVKLYDWIYSGDDIATDVISNYSGRIISIKNSKIILRIGQPYLISSGSFLHIFENNLIQKGESIATLIFERSKTGDIVQGLPRIEEILEARKKTDSLLNPHILLEVKFRECLSQGLNVEDATRLSFLEIQLLLVKEVQLVYQSQGVDIADKHIEVIIKQMTSKVKIESGGDTEYLPGEIVDLQKIEAINKSLGLINKKQALYYPILLGITKASLNTESFISAASFQETTKVLTEAAIAGKLDWLRGLKENVIIGRLIPAGTGFNVYNNNNSDIFNNCNYMNDVYFNSGNSSFDDIIVDDRNVHHFNSNNT